MILQSEYDDNPVIFLKLSYKCITSSQIFCLNYQNVNELQQYIDKLKDYKQCNSASNRIAKGRMPNEPNLQPTKPRAN